MKNLKLLFSLIALLSIGLTSCGDDLAEGVLVDSQNFTDMAGSEMLQRSSRGGNSCLEYVFPITIEFTDGTSATVGDQDELKAAVQTWKDNNLTTDDTVDGERGRNRGYRPDVVFPIQVTNEDGEVIDIASEEELRTARAECSGSGKGQKGNRNNRGDRANSCFSLVYPITVEFPDGSSQTFDDEDTKKEALKAYREANGRDAERPSTAYPVTVEYEDGTQASADSKEALEALKEACTEEG